VVVAGALFEVVQMIRKMMATDTAEPEPLPKARVVKEAD